MSSRQQVVQFLHTFKGCVQLERWSIKERPKNRQALMDLGMTPTERREVLLGLEPKDYVAGPEPDETDPSKDIWVFGKSLGGRSVYIKLRVVSDPRRKDAHRALVWSFHPAEHPMRYPLRGDGRK